MSTAIELNKHYAHRIAQDFSVGSEALDAELESAIFSELQVAHERGKILAQLELIAAQAENAKLREEVKRLAARDLNATIILVYNDGDNPFARETLEIVDVGVSDNTYTVESKVLNEALETDAE
jgi:hypothetical protein